MVWEDSEGLLVELGSQAFLESAHDGAGEGTQCRGLLSEGSIGGRPAWLTGALVLHGPPGQVEGGGHNPNPGGGDG